MIKKIFTALRPILKSLVVMGLILTLIFSQAQDANAASRSGGRMGGGSFRAPARTYSAPRPRTPAPSYGGGYGGYGYGGGFGFPFMMPFFGGWGFGSGGLFTTLMVIAIAGFLVQSFRKLQTEDGEETNLDNPTVSVIRLQVGMLAQARTLQTDLERIALSANTGSTEGLTKLLQDTSLALLRHPEYWMYAGSDSQLTRLNAAEAQFNRYSLAERSKFTTETLSNYNNQLQQAGATTALLEGDKPLDHPKGSGEYIVVTVIVGTQGKLQLPEVRNTDDLRTAINQLGAIGSEQLLAVEVLWSPEAKGDVLTSEDMIVGYPQLKMV